VNATSLSCLRRCVPVLLLACLVPAAALAETVVVLPASGAGVSSELIQSTRALFISRMARQDSRLLIIDLERPPAPEPPERTQALMVGMQARADAVILLDLRRAEGTSVLTVTGLRVPAGEQLFQYRQSTTAGPEVLPSLIEVAVASAFSRPSEAARAPWGPRQTFLGARVGAVVPFERAGDTDRPLFGMGIFVVKDFSRLFVDIGFTHNSAERGDEDRGNVTSFGLGAYLPFTAERTAPYLGASLRWRYSRFGGQGADGFVITPAVGLSWKRKDSLGLRLEAGVFYNLYEEKELDRLIPGSGAPHRSYGLELWVATWI
jgi:hypothetical protein